MSKETRGLDVCFRVVSVVARRCSSLLMVVCFLAVPAAVVVTALFQMGAGSSSLEEAASPASSSSASSAVSFELGHVICGDCCVGKIWAAIGSLPGVRDLDAKAGGSKFVMFYDQQVTSPEKVLAELVAAGESEATLAAVDPSNAVTERRWVRSVSQNRSR
jgi:hypothetical protein